MDHIVDRGGCEDRTHPTKLDPLDAHETPERASALGFPVNSFVSAEHPVPQVERDAEIVFPHVVLVMQIMNRSDEPETQLRFFVLQLMGIGGKGREEQPAGGESNSSLQRVKKTDRENRQGGEEIIEKFP